MNERTPIVLGAGLGGLLAAAGLARAGLRPLVLERASRPGGRFTAMRIQGCQVSTGALHLIPHADRGPLARLLRDLEIPVRIHRADCWASFWTPRAHRTARRLWDIPAVRGARTAIELAALTARLRAARGEERTVDGWLRAAGASTGARSLFDAFNEFALGLTTKEISVREERALLRSVLRWGRPGVPEGGCRAVIAALVSEIERAGGSVRTRQDVAGLELEAGRVSRVRVVDRTTREERAYAPTVVVSDLSPTRTWQLLGLASPFPQSAAAPRGLKIHVASVRSLIAHRGIMLCLEGTHRISGFAQPSNADPSLAASGKHLVISFQVMKSDDLELERRLALEDWRTVFGDAFDPSEVIAVSSFPRAWPVNWIRQGEDAPTATPWPNLFLVGDGVKPSGMMMTEGVAGSVRIALAGALRAAA